MSASSLDPQPLSAASHITHTHSLHTFSPRRVAHGRFVLHRVVDGGVQSENIDERIAAGRSSFALESDVDTRFDNLAQLLVCLTPSPLLCLCHAPPTSHHPMQFT